MESAKETVIIVHGTWAALDPWKRRWYEPVDSRPGDEPLSPKLDAALRERGSPARCWAHCTQGNQIFYWSGENSWIARTHAASSLGHYVAKLCKEGWRCHIVAHSHGGNVVSEALPQIIEATPTSGRPPGKIVTLGTPYMDTISPIEERTRKQNSLLRYIGAAWFLATSVMLGTGLSLTWGEHYFLVPAAIGMLTLVFIFIWIIAPWKRIRLSRWSQWKQGGGAGEPPATMLAIGSPTDEAWQILHHLTNIDNPLAVRSNLLRYVSSSLRAHMLRNIEVAHISGAKSFRDLGIVAKCVALLMDFYAVGAVIVILALYALYFFPSGAKMVATFLHIEAVPKEYVNLVLPVLQLAISAPFVIPLFLRPVLGTAFYSAYLSPFRWCAQGVESLVSVGPAFVTYLVRRQSWPVLLKMAIGLEGYRARSPRILQCPNYLSVQVEYEDMPNGAEQRALDKRSAWLGDFSQTLSKIATTAADITSLLRTVEANPSLVHGAYYNDDECIARIADWIAGRR